MGGPAPQGRARDLPAWAGWVGLALIGLGLTLHGLGDHPLVDFDEAVHAGFIRAMASGHHWLAPVFDGTLRLRKPPLYFWVAALIARLLGGATPFTDRLPSAVAGVLTAVVIAGVAERLWGWRRGGVLGGIALITMPQFLMLSRAAMLDTVSAGLVAVAVLSGSRLLRGRGGLGAGVLLGAACGLEVIERSAMVLLPLAILGVDALWLHRPSRVRWGALALAGLVALAIALPWPIAMALRYPHHFPTAFLLQNILDRVTGSVQQAPLPPTFYLPLLAAGLGAWAPVVALAAAASWRRAWRDPDGAERLALIWIVVTVVAFSVSRTKLDWYVLPAYPACALLLAAWLGLRLDRGVGALPSAADPGMSGWLVGLAGVTGAASGIWPAPRPVGVLGLAGLVGLAGLWWSLRPGPDRPDDATARPGSALGRRAAAAGLLAALVVAGGRAGAVPLTMGTPGLALSLEPEPDTVAEAALGRAAARAPGVPLAVLDNTYPTLLYYSGRTTIRTLAGPARAAAARGDWLVLPATEVAFVRRSAGSLRVLDRAGPLVLARLPGAPAPGRP
ncbi:MAG TPA: glycosyltransferase family 39 protein [Verrucomicrobiae bacterium]|nr:glycosyltransferase family 39 protein [Verrucomicrobiae bacterium]